MSFLTADDFFKDVAMIYQPDVSFGSGRLIAPRLVLTARHVVETAAHAPVDMGWKLKLLRERTIEGFENKWKSHGAKVVWRGQGLLDLALLRTEDDIEGPALGNLVFAFHEKFLSRPDVGAAGFPEATWDDDGQPVEYSLQGDLKRSSEHGPYAWTVPEANVPLNASKWQGMSGAAVAAEGGEGELHLFGVVQSVLTEFSGGQLQVARIYDALEEDEDFKGILTDALGKPPRITWDGAWKPSPATPAFPSGLADVVHVFDRRPHAEYIGSLIGPGPIEILLCGHDDDMLDLFVQRLEEHTLASDDTHVRQAGRPQSSPAKHKVVPIEWTGLDWAEMRFVSARGLLRKSIGIDDPAEIDIGRALHRGLQRLGESAWVDLRINAGRFGDGDVKALQDWRQFWRDARAVGDLPPCGVIYSISGITGQLTPELIRALGSLADHPLSMPVCTDVMVRDWWKDLEDWGAGADLINAARGLDQRFVSKSFRLRALDDYLKTGK